MSLSLGLVYAFAILLPGFFFYGSIFISRTEEGLTTNSPAPSSVLSIFLLGFGACLGHIMGISGVLLNAWMAQYVGAVCVPFNPDIYQTLFSFSGAGTPDMWAVLTYLLAISFLTYSVSKFIQRRYAYLFTALTFGSYSYLAKEIRSADTLVIAYVVTPDKTGKSQGYLGYQGVVANLNHDRSGVNFIHLHEAVPFCLKEQKGALKKVSLRDKNRGPISNLYLPGERITNLSLDVIEIQDEETS